MQTDKPGSLSDKFAGFGAAPTDQLWNSIAASLDQKEKKRRGFFWWWFGGIAAVGLVVFSVYEIGYHFGKTETQSTNQVSASQALASDSSNTDNETVSANHSPEDSSDTATIAVRANLHSPQSSSDTGTISVRANIHSPQSSSVTGTISVRSNLHSPQSSSDTGTISVRANIHSPQDSSDTGTISVRSNLHSPQSSSDTGTISVRANIHSPQDSTDNGNVTVRSNSPQGSINEQHQSAQMEFLNHELTPLPLASIVPFTEFSEPVFGLSINAIEKRKLTGRWEMGFSVGTLAGYQAHNQKMGLDPNVQIFTADNLSLENSITGSGVQSLSGYAEIDATIKRPLGLEFSIARTFGKRGSVGSGIGLNYFTGQNLYPLQMTMRSNFLSISIPLVVDFDFVKRRRFEVSLGTGVVSEFPFRVTSKTTYTTPYETSTATKDFSGGYMGSVLFRTGFSCRLNEHLKIGLNPNLRYYFYQSLKSEMPVLERNFWGGVSLGATWTF